MGCLKLDDRDFERILFASASNFSNDQKSSLSNYEMFFRDYDPAIGRMMGIDPYAELYRGVNPYHYALNNPIMMNDPSGGIPMQRDPDELMELREAWERSNGGGGNIGSTANMVGLGYSGFSGYGLSTYEMVRNQERMTSSTGWSVATYENSVMTSFNSGTNVNSFVDYAVSNGAKVYVRNWDMGNAKEERDGGTEFEGGWLDVESFEGMTYLANRRESLSERGLLRFRIGQGDQNGGRPTFAGGVMYSDVVQGLNDIWSASGVYKGEGRRENLAVFTSKGLLVLPNSKNTRDNSGGSLSFFQIRFVDNKPQINWNNDGTDNWISILGVIHTHPDPMGYQQHAEYWESPGDWLWTKSGLSHFIMSTSGVYEGTYDGSDYNSAFIGFRNDKTFNLIANKYGL